MEPIEEFIACKGTYEISFLIENDDNAPYKSKSLAILNYCMDNYKHENCYITEYLGFISSRRRD